MRSAFYSKSVFRNIKYCLQRIHRGYCDVDLRSVDDWFLNVVPPMLKQFAKDCVGYPTRFEMEWYENHQDELDMTFDELRCCALDKKLENKKEAIHNATEKDWKNLLFKIADNFEKARYYFEEDGLTEETGFEKAENIKMQQSKSFPSGFSTCGIKELKL